MSPEEAQLRIEQGWQFIAINSELKMMMDGVASTLAKVGLKSDAGAAKY
jgi:4-hydroxy-2-oxoheptanedioate aldolase